MNSAMTNRYEKGKSKVEILLKPYQVMNGGVLISLESLWHYSSQKSGVKAVCTEAIREKRPITTARWQAQ